MKKNITPLWFILIAVLLSACSSPRKAELTAGTDPDKAVAEVTKLRNAAQQDQLDVLADDAFAKGSVYLEDAQRGLKQGDAAGSVLENAGIAKAFFQDARDIADARRTLASRILEARESALQAGVRNSDDLVETLEDIDDELKSDTKQFSRALSPEDFSAYQKQYLALETRAVQHRELSGARQAIEQATDDNAKKLAPESLRAASLDYETAMNTIAQSPRSPAIYKLSLIHI